jgi:hypothetical protein
MVEARATVYHAQARLRVQLIAGIRGIEIQTQAFDVARICFDI